MAKRISTLEREQAYRDEFLCRLNQALSVPTAEWPTVRCWTKSAFNKLIRQVKDDLAAEGMETRLSHHALLDWVCRLRLACPIPVDENGAVYLSEIGASSSSDVDPHELLMASKPAGTICYFSAVAFHELTTQLVKHHHVAELSPSKREDDRSEVPPDRSRPKGPATPRGFGTLLFRYQDTPFYSTRRVDRLIPGIQTRNYGPRSRIRMTTLEQTLLDTLYKPFHCGGPEVVFEAWREGMTSRRVDEERLAEYLRRMNYPATSRRVGVMLELVGRTPGDELRRTLLDVQEAIDRQGLHARISLLPGVEYQDLNERWMVSTP